MYIYFKFMIYNWRYGNVGIGSEIGYGHRVERDKAPFFLIS